MIAVVSASSPWSSVALFTEAGAIAWREDEAPRAASGTLLRQLDECLSDVGAALGDIEVFVADVGPGSFIGSRVGVMLAKTLALVQGRPVAAVESFDLMDPSAAVAVPCRRHEWWLRAPGAEPTLVSELAPGVPTYGLGAEHPRYPLARRWIVQPVVGMPPEMLVPQYRVEPSISQPKVPFRQGGGA